MNENFNVGDRIRINCKGSVCTGTVTQADNWGRRSGWYIQFVHGDGRPGYWKQGVDGGTVEKL